MYSAMLLTNAAYACLGMGRTLRVSSLFQQLEQTVCDGSSIRTIGFSQLSTQNKVPAERFGSPLTSFSSAASNGGPTSS